MTGSPVVSGIGMTAGQRMARSTIVGEWPYPFEGGLVAVSTRGSALPVLTCRRFAPTLASADIELSGASCD